MALMGDSIDNIPGAKGIGEKGARELIKRFGSAESALKHAAEVEGKRYREALENSREAVLLSKQLAIIDTAAPVKLVLNDLAIREPDVEALRVLYSELGFTSCCAIFLCVHGGRCRKRFRGAGIASCAQEIFEVTSARCGSGALAHARSRRARD